MLRLLQCSEILNLPSKRAQSIFRRQFDAEITHWVGTSSKRVYVWISLEPKFGVLTFSFKHKRFSLKLNERLHESAKIKYMIYEALGKFEQSLYFQYLPWSKRLHVNIGMTSTNRKNYILSNLKKFSGLG